MRVQAKLPCRQGCTGEIERHVSGFLRAAQQCPCFQKLTGDASGTKVPVLAGTDAPLPEQAGPRNLVVEQMIPLFILAFSVLALVRFAVSQWRAIWITAASQPLSESFQLTAGIDTIGGREFATLINLCDHVSAELKHTSY